MPLTGPLTADEMQSSWHYWMVKDIEVLESVRHRATRQVKGLNGSYEEKLEQCV